MKLKASMTLLSALASLCLDCSEAPGSSRGFSFAPASSASSPSSQSSSSQRALAPGYFHDDGGHWREYEGDATHERVSYAPHEFGDWRESGGALQRECEVCGYAEAHEHTFPEGYEHDGSAHWREADCGHSAREDYGPHEWALSYDVENDAIVRVHTCAVCGYQTKESTYDPAFIDSVTFAEADDGGLEVSAIGDYKDAPVLNYPRSYEGRPVTSIRIYQQQSEMNAPAKSDNNGVVFVPSSVKRIQGYMADKTNIDLFYEGTLEDWLSIKTGFIVRSSINLHLKDESGSYYRLKDVTLPAGTKSLRMYALAFTTVESVRCNDELEKMEGVCFMGCRYLREVVLNDGLLEIRLDSLSYCTIESLRIPSSVQKIVGQLEANNLYELVIEEGATPEMRKDSFQFSRRLVRLLDYRKTRSEELAHTQPLVATAEDPDRVKIHRDQGYVLMETVSGFSLLDYRGGETCISVPSIFNIGDKEVNAYSTNSYFLYAPTLVGGDVRALSYEEYNNLARYDNFFEGTFTESLLSCEKDTFYIWRNFFSFRRAYFRMGKEAMLERIGEDVDAWMRPEYDPYCLPEFFYLENGEYVCLNPRAS